MMDLSPPQPEAAPSTQAERRERRRNRGAVHYDFLPAVLEVQETPPSPIGRAILWLLMLFFTVALVWAIVGRVDVVAVAPGKVIPSGRSKTVQPLEMGIITRILVTEGQQVRAGDVLVELDPTATAADQRRLEAEAITIRLQRARMQTLLELAQSREVAIDALFPEVRGADAQAIALQKSLLADELAEHVAGLAALDHGLERKTAELEVTRNLVRKYEATVPLIATRVAALQQLLDQQLAAEAEYLTLKQELVEHEHDLAAYRARLTEIEAAITEIREQRNVQVADFRSTVLNQLAEADRRLQSVEEELVKARQRSGLQKLIASIDGTVQQLAIHTVGGVVTPAQELMVVVPDNELLEVEAMLANRDIGFVREGQHATIKVDAFPFTKYGTLDGTVVHISRDAIADDQLGLVYALKVTLEENQIMVDGRPVRLTPGMAVTAEVTTGDRRLIEFFLSPLLRFKDESIRER